MIYNKKLLFVLAASMMIASSCGTNHKDTANTVLTLTNSSGIDLQEKAVSLSRSALESKVESKKFPLLQNSKGDTVPSQLVDLDGDEEWDEMFLLVDLQANEAKKLNLQWVNAPLDLESRTYVRFGVRASEEDIVRSARKDTFYPDQLPGVMGYQPYQTDGPSWENDKVGFRHYLDGRNSKDVFGKKVSALSPEDVGINAEGVTEDNYHVMEDWGRDILSVGNSVGIGGFGLKIGDRLARIGVTEQDTINNVEATHFEVMASGPVRSLIRYDYENWKPQGMDRTYQAKEITDIWPGMYAFKNTIQFEALQGDEEAVIGLVNSNTDKPLRELKVGNYTLLYTHDRQTYDKEWYLGLALIIPNEAYLGSISAPKTGSLSNTFLARLQVENGKPISYYAVAAWELADAGFAEEAYFEDYLIHLTKQLDAQVEIAITSND